MDNRAVLTRIPPEKSRRRRAAGNQMSVWRLMQNVMTVGLLMATLFTLWTPANLFSSDLMDRMILSLQPVSLEEALLPTATEPAKPLIGVVAGHWGNDPGAVCADGLTEEKVNLEIANRVKDILSAEGYDVVLLQEFDARLFEFRAAALVSIHNDSCDYINDQATGFKVAAAQSSVYPEKATRLTACLTQRYQAATQMTFHYNTVTGDMTDYHAFREIHSDTTAAIIETGFLNLDRKILTENTDLVARGVADGILCFVRNENIPDTAPVTP